MADAANYIELREPIALKGCAESEFLRADSIRRRPRWFCFSLLSAADNRQKGSCSRIIQRSEIEPSARGSVEMENRDLRPPAN